MVKCCAACLIAFASIPYLNEVDGVWFFISMVLVMSPDSNEALPLAIMRIKANLIASMVSLLIMLLGMPQIINICIAFCIVIAICQWFNLMLGVRPALAAVVIIMLHPGGEVVWKLAANRAFYVALGCLIGFLLTILFHRTFFNKKITKPDHATE